MERHAFVGIQKAINSRLILFNRLGGQLFFGTKHSSHDRRFFMPCKKFSIQASYDQMKFKAPNWPPGESDITRRERYGEYVEKKKRENRKLLKLTSKGVHLARPEAPNNGLLVEGLVPTAGEVIAARNAVIEGVERLLPHSSALFCSACSALFLGQEKDHQLRNCTGKGMHARDGAHIWLSASSKDILSELECFHLFDRLTTLVTHDYRLQTPTLPPVVELCIQAGVNMENFPVLRRKSPVYRKLLPTTPAQKVEERDEWSLEDMLNGGDPEEESVSDEGHSEGEASRSSFSEGEESEQESSDSEEEDMSYSPVKLEELELTVYGDSSKTSLGKAKVKGPKTWSWDGEIEGEVGDELTPFPPLKEDPDLGRVAKRTLKAWLRLRGGVATLITKYRVLTCGYCPEVHVGPRGHKVRMCDGGKHQRRHGQHGWQQAILDDICPPKYVLHKKENGPFLKELRSFYGMSPVVVKLCVDAGAEPPKAFIKPMRLDVVIPELEELENAI